MEDIKENKTGEYKVTVGGGTKDPFLDSKISLLFCVVLSAVFLVNDRAPGP